MANSTGNGDGDIGVFVVGLLTGGFLGFLGYLTVTSLVGRRASEKTKKRNY